VGFYEFGYTLDWYRKKSSAETLPDEESGGHQFSEKILWRKVVMAAPSIPVFGLFKCNASGHTIGNPYSELVER
jgi:hypothetical protein